MATKEEIIKYAKRALTYWTPTVAAMQISKVYGVQVLVTGGCLEIVGVANIVGDEK